MAGLCKLTTLIQNLLDALISRPLRNFPVKIIYEPIGHFELNISSDYYPGLKFSEIPNFVIDCFRQGENITDDKRCLDAFCVLIDYSNVVVYSRFNHSLKLEPKKIDDWNSSIVSSTRLADGEDSCIT